MATLNPYQMYLQALKRPFKKLTKLEFLNPDNSVAFFVGSEKTNRAYMGKHDSRAFIQSGSLNVSLQNGTRRTASITLANTDKAFDYSINNIWFGSQVRLLMGLVLPDGTEFYLPQGVFYIKSPSETFSPTTNQITYSLVDKWSYLDGSLFGTLPASYVIKRMTNAFQAMQGVLSLSRNNLISVTKNPFEMIDSVTPTFTDYYNGITTTTYEYTLPSGETRTVNVAQNQTAYDIIVDRGKTAADVLLELNSNLVSLIGYDQTGSLRVDPAAEDINDSQKPILWYFNRGNSQLLSYNSTIKNEDVYNDIVVYGSGIDNKSNIYGRATNYDPSSYTNANLIGLKSRVENKPEFWKTEQCVDYAKWLLKRKTILQKSVTLKSSQMFHLTENSLIDVERTDKKGSPVERHLIQSISIPIGETGEMSITATSASDLSGLATTVTTS